MVRFTNNVIKLILLLVAVLAAVGLFLWLYPKYAPPIGERPSEWSYDGSKAFVLNEVTCKELIWMDTDPCWSFEQ